MMRWGFLAFLLVGASVTGLAGCGGPSTPSRAGPSFQQQIVQAQKESLPEVRARKLVQIGYRQAKAKDDLGAEETLRLAVRACQAVKDPSSRTAVFSALAEVHARLGNRSQSRRAAQSALAAAREVDDPETKARSLATAGRAEEAAGDAEGAAGTLREAEQLAGQFDDVFTKSLVLDPVALSYHKIGRRAEADRVIHAALELAQTIEDDRKRCEAIAEAAATYSAMDNEETSRTTFDLALQTARMIENPQSHAYALADIAEKLSKAGHHAKTHEVLKEADLVAHQIPQRDQQRITVEAIRVLMATLPKPAG